MKNSKYELTNETIEFEGVTLHRIKALRDFGDIKAGDLGGYVESEKNLDIEGNCWISDNAKVYEDAFIKGDAIVKGQAIVRGEACIAGNCCIYDSVIIEGKTTCTGHSRIMSQAYVKNAEIEDEACISGHTKIYGGRICNEACIRGNVEVYGGSIEKMAQLSGSAKIHGRPLITDNAKIYGNARIYGAPRISDSASVLDNALVYGNANIFGTAIITGNAVVCEYMSISGGHCTRDLRSSIEESIRCQTGLVPINGEVIAYKTVNSDLTSIFNENFKYEIGEWAEVDFYDDSILSCAEGLHFSHAHYWDDELENGQVIIAARIKLEDIITVQCGKIRCKKAFILGSYKL